MSSPRSPIILLISNDASLTYLIERYAERSGCEVRAHPIVPAPLAGLDDRPASILFSAIEDLEAAQSQIAQLASAEIPLLVCSSINDQTRARELGAEQCLVHPLTYDGFIAALTAARISFADQPG